MKRKNLLNETQVRKFMKLANINEDLTNNFLTEEKAGKIDRKHVANIIPDAGQLKEEDEADAD